MTAALTEDLAGLLRHHLDTGCRGCFYQPRDDVATHLAEAVVGHLDLTVEHHDVTIAGMPVTLTRYSGVKVEAHEGDPQ